MIEFPYARDYLAVIPAVGGEDMTPCLGRRVSFCHPHA
jgi:hypothetical protein